MLRSPLTPAQIRAGRALLDWSRQQLAEASEISLSSVRDYEKERRSGEIAGLRALRSALESAGVEFLPGNDSAGPGVRLTTRSPTVLSIPTQLRDGGLVIPAEWRGGTLHIYVSREALEDLGQITADQHVRDEEWGGIFHDHRIAILDAAAAAASAGRITPDRRVHVRIEDVLEFADPDPGARR